MGKVIGTTGTMSELIQDPEKKEIMVDEEKHRRESATEYIDELEQAYQADISFAAILNGTAAAPLTIFEKKAALINAELDKFGMGRYQWCIWFLCGFGYFLDLAWAEGVGLGAISMYQEFGVLPARQGDIYSCANAGLAIGALVFGLLVDVIGRKWAFNLTCLICSFFGLFLVSRMRGNFAIANITIRLLPITIMEQSARSTFFRVLDLVATSRSMLQSPWNSFRKAAEILWLFSPCGSRSGLLLQLRLHMGRPPNGAAILHCLPVTDLAFHAASLQTIWVGDMSSSSSDC